MVRGRRSAGTRSTTRSPGASRPSRTHDSTAAAVNIFDSDASPNRVPGVTGVPLARSATPTADSSSAAPAARDQHAPGEPPCRSRAASSARRRPTHRRPGADACGAWPEARAHDPEVVDALGPAAVVGLLLHDVRPVGQLEVEPVADPGGVADLPLGHVADRDDPVLLLEPVAEHDVADLVGRVRPPSSRPGVEPLEVDVGGEAPPERVLVAGRRSRPRSAGQAWSPAQGAQSPGPRKRTGALVQSGSGRQFW